MNNSKWLRQAPFSLDAWFRRGHKRQHAAIHTPSIRRGSNLPCIGRIIFWTRVQIAVQRARSFLDEGPACRAMMKMTMTIMMYTCS